MFGIFGNDFIMIKLQGRFWTFAFVKYSFEEETSQDAAQPELHFLFNI